MLLALPVAQARRFSTNMLPRFHLPTIERSVSYAVTVLAGENYDFERYLIDENEALRDHDSHVRSNEATIPGVNLSHIFLDGVIPFRLIPFRL